MLTQEQKQLIRDLNSYNYLHYKLADMTEQYAKSIKHIEDEILAIDKQLSDGDIKSIQFEKVPSRSARKNTRVVELIYEQDILKKRKELVKAEQIKEVDKISNRIEDIEIYLKKLNDWERQFITHMYIETRYIEYMMDVYNLSKSTVYRKATNILNKMLKK
jgi:small-conductance mechanosensitive channel|uniref:Sigma-70, region 4 n=1 Tax=Siphoviridae sp. ctGuJ10 TaxID=2825418 RepID=A0A8S5PV24_9CAUD|nr:MAG TPA: Sigma-70, region 4 [Siphoviridae sp. ctGuJ10]